MVPSMRSDALGLSSPITAIQGACMTYPRRIPNRDCSSCEHSVEQSPDNAGKEYRDLPCATCKPMEPQDQHRDAQLHLVEKRSENTWGTGFLKQGEPDMPTQEATRLGRIFQSSDPSFLADFCTMTKGYTQSELLALHKFCESLSEVEMRIIGHLATLGWNCRQCRVASAAGVSKQAVNNTMKRIAARFPALTAVLQPNIRRRRGE